MGSIDLDRKTMRKNVAILVVGALIAIPILIALWLALVFGFLVFNFV